MRRTFLVSLILALLSAIAVAGVSTAQDESEPQFVLGFQEFHSFFPDLVGDPLENERHDQIGNAFQQTTGGFLAWHRLDNTLDFTDGSQTFILTTDGLLGRDNGERFQFELVREQLEDQLEADISLLVEAQADQLDQLIEDMIALTQDQLEVELELIEAEQIEQIEPIDEPQVFEPEAIEQPEGIEEEDIDLVGIDEEALEQEQIDQSISIEEPQPFDQFPPIEGPDAFEEPDVFEPLE